jgi:hypothetical protein
MDFNDTGFLPAEVGTEVYNVTSVLRIVTSMTKKTEQWLLFKYIDGEFTPLSKPFKTRKDAEEQRQKYPERERRGIAVGVIRS